MGKRKGKGPAPGPAQPRSKPTSESDSGNVPPSGAVSGPSTVPSSPAAISSATAAGTPILTALSSAPAAVPSAPTAEPIAPAASPTTPSAILTAPSTVLTTPAAIPTAPSTVPITPTTVSTTPKAVPTAPKAVPTAPKAVPTAPKAVPTAPKAVPTAPKAVPTAPTTIPTTPTAAPTSPTIVPTSPTVVPTAPTTVPTAPTAVPTAPTAVLTAPTVIPTAPTVVPTAPTAVTTTPATVSSPPTAVSNAPTALLPSTPVFIQSSVPPVAASPSGPSAAITPSAPSAAVLPSLPPPAVQHSAPPTTPPTIVPSAPAAAFALSSVADVMSAEDLKTADQLVLSPQTKPKTQDNTAQKNMQNSQPLVTGAPAAPRREPQQIKHDNSNVVAVKETRATTTFTPTSSQQETPQITSNLPSHSEIPQLSPKETEILSKRPSVPSQIVEVTPKTEFSSLKLELQEQIQSILLKVESESQVPTLIKEKIGVATQGEECVPQEQKSPHQEIRTKMELSELPIVSAEVHGSNIQICPVAEKLGDSDIATPKEQNTKEGPEKGKGSQKPELPKKPPGLMQMKSTKTLPTQPKPLDAQTNNENKQKVSNLATKTEKLVSDKMEEIKNTVSSLPIQMTSLFTEQVQHVVQAADKSCANQKDTKNVKCNIKDQGDNAKEFVKGKKDVKNVESQGKLPVSESSSQSPEQSISHAKMQELQSNKTMRENEENLGESLKIESATITPTKNFAEAITCPVKDARTIEVKKESAKENIKDINPVPVKTDKDKSSVKQPKIENEASKNGTSAAHEKLDVMNSAEKLNGKKSQEQQNQNVSSQKEAQKSQNQTESNQKQPNKGKDGKQKDGKSVNKTEVTKVIHPTETQKTSTENPDKDLHKEVIQKDKPVPKSDIKPTLDIKSKSEKSTTEKTDVKRTENINKEVSKAKEDAVKSNENKKSPEKSATEKVPSSIPNKENKANESKKGMQPEKGSTETETCNKQTKDAKKDASKIKGDDIDKKDGAKSKSEQDKQKQNAVSQKDGTKTKEEKQKSEQKSGPEKSNEEKKKSSKQAQQKDVIIGKETGETSQPTKTGNESVKAQKGTNEKENKGKSSKAEADNKGVSEKGKAQSKKVESKSATDKGKVEKENVSKTASKVTKKPETSSLPKVEDEKICNSPDGNLQKILDDIKSLPKMQSATNTSVDDEKSETPLSLLSNSEESAAVAKKKRRRKKKKPTDGASKMEIQEEGKQDSSTKPPVDPKKVQGTPTQVTKPKNQCSTVEIKTATTEPLDNTSTGNSPSEKGEIEISPSKKKKNKRKKKQGASGNLTETGTSIASNDFSINKKSSIEFGKSNLTNDRLAHHLSNCCCVCKSTGKNNAPVLTCSACSLACYCGREHQVQHWPEHKEFCNYICTVLSKERPYFFSPAEKMNHDERRQFKLSELQLCQTTFNRMLTPLESALILHPRACFTCYKPVFQNVCTNCHCINYCCLEHLPPDHKIWCDTLRIKLLFVQSQKEHGSAGVTVPKPSKLCYPMNSNMKEYLQNLDFSSPCNMSKDLYNAHISELATYPLTLLHALQLLATQGATNPLQYEHLVVHVVGAEDVYECCQMLKWKYFFVNLLPKLKTLHLVFIGCELSIDDEKVHVEGRLVYEFHAKMTYLDYCKKCYIKPSIVCAFNSGLYRSTGYKGSDTWGPSLTPMLNMNHGAPLLLTAYTHMEAQLDLQRLKEIFLNKLHVVQQPLKNPYASIFPNHNLVSEHECPVAFRNYFMTIVRHA